jgi:hypothetical protein
MLPTQPVQYLEPDRVTEYTPKDQVINVFDTLQADGTRVVVLQAMSLESL